MPLFTGQHRTADGTGWERPWHSHQALLGQPQRWAQRRPCQCVAARPRPPGCVAAQYRGNGHALRWGGRHRRCRCGRRRRRRRRRSIRRWLRPTAGPGRSPARTAARGSAPGRGGPCRWGGGAGKSGRHPQPTDGGTADPTNSVFFSPLNAVPHCGRTVQDLKCVSVLKLFRHIGRPAGEGTPRLWDQDGC